MSSDSLLVALTTKPWVCIGLPEKPICESWHIATLNWFFLRVSLSDCSSWISRLHKICQTRENYWQQTFFLNCIGHKLEFNFFSFWIRYAQWSSRSSSGKWEVRTLNLGQIFEIEFGWLVKHTTDDYFQRQIALFESTWPLNIAFHLWPVSLQILVTISSESEIVSKLLRTAVWSHCAA